MEQKKIKVLFIINDLRVGGAQNMVIEEIQAMDEKCFSPYLMTLFAYGSPDLRSRTGVVSGKYVEFAFRGFFDVRSWFLIYQYIKRGKFDAVVTNLFDSNVVGRVLAIATKVPVILSWEHNVYYDKKRWQIVVDKFLSRFTYRILVGAPQVKTFTLKQEGLHPEKIDIVYDAAKLVFTEVRKNRNDTLEKYRFPKDCTYIVGCGHLTEQKGHTYLIEAARVMKERRGNLDGIRFLIFGEGVLKDSLLEQIRDSNLQEHVFLCGVAPMEDILAMSDIFSLISLWEGFSIALIQAMNAGCTIVASRVSGSVDAIENEVSGLLVSPGDSQMAANSFMSLMEDSSLAERLGVAASKKSELFDIRHHVEQIEKIIRSGLKTS